MTPRAPRTRIPAASERAQVYDDRATRIGGHQPLHVREMVSGVEVGHRHRLHTKRIRQSTRTRRVALRHGHRRTVMPTGGDHRVRAAQHDDDTGAPFVHVSISTATIVAKVLDVAPTHSCRYAGRAHCAGTPSATAERAIHAVAVYAGAPAPHGRTADACAPSPVGRPRQYPVVPRPSARPHHDGADRRGSCVRHAPYSTRVGHGSVERYGAHRRRARERETDCASRRRPQRAGPRDLLG